MYHTSCGLFKHVGGTLKLAELAIVNYCHHEINQVVNNSDKPDIDESIDGAYVLLPQIGLHENVGSIDIGSLYPNAIRTINISPETIRGQFDDKIDACEAIGELAVKLLTLVLDEGGEKITKFAYEWNEWLRENKMSVSGYGTVFDQSKIGIIPSIITGWIATRKKYQAMKKDSEKAGDESLANYYDRLQYVYKIKLNSLYGALTNLFFRFYDLRMGESTTGTGRMILKHQCRKVAETLDGKYDVDFPLYATVKDATEKDKAGNQKHTMEEAQLISLDGTKFQGKFQTESVVYGDTDSTYFLTHAVSIDEAIQIADAVAKVVNASYPEFVTHKFLCQPEFSKYITANREIVSDRGIFVDKKRYILHIVDKEGKKKDEMKVMGLDTKKTTLPTAVSKKLNHFIERYLKGETWEELSRDIVKYKDELKNSKDIMDIGLPKGVNKMEEYTEKYVEDPDCKLQSGGAAASIHYNECLKEYDDKVSMDIKSGMKIKIFYLKRPHGRFKTIAIPTDIEIVPSWFLENFEIDKNAHILRLIDNPLTNIIKAIGKNVPTKHSLMVDDLLGF
jgi:DNA polymerase elongation subunit (family B)